MLNQETFEQEKLDKLKSVDLVVPKGIGMIKEGSDESDAEFDDEPSMSVHEGTVNLINAPPKMKTGQWK